MRALVVYETKYGNSENVVRVIAEAFGEHGEALLREGQALEERAEELENVAGVRPKTRLMRTEPAPSCRWWPRKEAERKGP
jgi:flavodoxin